MFEFRFDDARGVLCLKSSGFVLPEDAPRHFDELCANADEARARAGRLRILADGREGTVLAAETAEIFGQFEARLFRSPEDRVAILVSSSLLKMQVQRMLQSDRAQFFLSESDAMAWLEA